ncbi:MAG: hypothetical protein AAF447_11580 [Myxococcota bacterium]
MTVPDDDGVGRRTLTAEERALLRRVCERHRRTIPVYLKAGQEELRRLDAILAKLDDVSR